MTQKFFTGDKVIYTQRDNGFWEVGQTHIINKCSYRGGGLFEYSTTRGAWFSDNDFELVHRATKASFKQLDKSLSDENEE